MRYPINGTITVTGAFKEVAQPGTGLADSRGIKRHIGVDLRAYKLALYAPKDGVVTASYTSSSSGMQVIELRIDNKLWRFLHLSSRLVRVGQTVKEGQKIGVTGNSGGVPYHLHMDVRKNGTTWNQSLSNYYDPLALIEKELTVATLTTKTDLNFLYKTMLGRSRSTGEGEDVYLQRDYKFVANDLWNSDEAKNRRAAQAKELANMRADIISLRAEIAKLKAQPRESADTTGLRAALKKFLGL